MNWAVHVVIHLLHSSLMCVLSIKENHLHFDPSGSPFYSFLGFRVPRLRALGLHIASKLQ